MSTAKFTCFLRVEQGGSVLKNIFTVK